RRPPTHLSATEGEGNHVKAIHATASACRRCGGAAVVGAGEGCGGGECFRPAIGGSEFVESCRPEHCRTPSFARGKAALRSGVGGGVHHASGASRPGDQGVRAAHVRSGTGRRQGGGRGPGGGAAGWAAG